MADIIKKNSENTEKRAADAAKGPITPWQVKPYGENGARKPKIVKAAQVDGAGKDNEVPVIRSGGQTPVIETIGSGEHIEGIDITCSCGEHIRVYFDYEDQ